MASADIAALPSQPAIRQKWKTVILASLGGSLEIYDFIIYGVFAREIARQFFPATDPLASLISTFSVFAIGYVSRPLGGIVLSSLGDRFGRRMIFLVSVLAMSAATIGIGLIPSYASIGVMAPALLVLLRLAQGFFLAGELPCSITYVVEEIPVRASLVSGLVIFCLNSGVLTATLISLALHSLLNAADVLTYGWRIAFIFGGVIGLVSYWLRTSLEESKEYQRLKSHKVKRPFRKVLTGYPKQVAIGVGVAGIVNASNSLLFVVLPSYMTTVLHYAPATVSAGQNLGIATMSASLLLFAWLGDTIPSRHWHRLGSLVMLFGSYPFYRLVAAHQIDPFVAFMTIGFVGGFVNGAYAYLLADLFPTNVRFSGIALSLNLATVVFTGITPLVVTQLLHHTGSTTAPGIFLTGIALIALLAGAFVNRFSGQIARATN
ncbi:MFS transporter [Paraburkholderia rhynchosiae]|uniref:MFS transporter n=1 Tax=Paraburkholderia rhynchosiae TaxID=487049 RepID=A0A2N7WIW3_9BURK|nr:MFS transporter [Paraburkholderia rhynchosiae]PMS29301.1 MFS transporter [Paraburkholderia rhynchosiae]CAB3709288.1 Proline/betaine transporter [Paraburkholderia rhynchosiae]